MQINFIQLIWGTSNFKKAHSFSYSVPGGHTHVFFQMDTWELDSAIDSYVPMKKQGKRSKKKHLSKEAFRKIRHKQNIWRVYKHTGKDHTDYEGYKEALNAATNEVRKSKRNFEHKLAQNIKSDSKSFYMRM